LRLAVVYAFWTLLYAVDTVGLDVLFTPAGREPFISALVISKYHLWFLRTLIGVYFLVPALHAVARHEGGRYLPFCCAAFFAFVVVKGTVLLYPGISPHVQGLLWRVEYELAGYSGYFMLGYLLTKRDLLRRIKSRYLLLMLAAVIGVSAWLGHLHAVGLGRPSDILYEYRHLPAFLGAVIIFVLFTRMQSARFDKYAGPIQTASKCTFVIYLLHPFVLEHLEGWFGISALSFNAWVSVPAISVFVFLVCGLIALALHKIPIVNKWLV